MTPERWYAFGRLLSNGTPLAVQLVAWEDQLGASVRDGGDFHEQAVLTAVRALAELRRRLDADADPDAVDAATAAAGRASMCLKVANICWVARRCS